MDFTNYKFRCHYQGNLVSAPSCLSATLQDKLISYRDRFKGNGKPLTVKQTAEYHALEVRDHESKNPKLSTTAEKTCAEIVYNAKFKRKYTLQNKYFEKGLWVEKEARDILSSVLGVMLTSDPDHKSNDWVVGARDVKLPDLIIDIKSTWDISTFCKHITDSNEEFYKRQLDSYMDLWGIKDSLLSFILVDTPDHLLNQEITRRNYSLNFIGDDGEIRDNRIDEVKKLVTDHLFTRENLESFCRQSGTIRIEWFDDFKEIEIKDRVHLVAHPYNETRIEQRNHSLRLCREFMNNIKAINNLNYK